MELSYNKAKNDIISYLEPTSLLTETYRSLRTNIQYSLVDKKIKTILITSPGSKEGKTTTACNLAIVTANAENKVLLIDADLRKPNVHNMFKIKNMYGLTNVLLNDINVEEIVQKTDDIKNLDILTAGLNHPNPIEVISSNKMRQFLLNVFEKYDTVIIDSPPIGYVSDGLILGRLVDGVVLTIAIGETNIGMAKQCIKQLNNVNANILGITITKIKEKIIKHY